jgi:ATP-dependent Lhr-like helicase
MVYHGTKLILISKKNASELKFLVPPESPYTADCAVFFKDLLSRDSRPLSSVRVRSVNGVGVHDSPYRDALAAAGFRKGYMDYSMRRSR